MLKSISPAFKSLAARRAPIASLSLRAFACDASTAGPETIQAMRDKLQKEFEPVMLEIVDPFGDASSVEIKIVSEKFEGMLPLARHRAINTLLQDEIKQIHAVQIFAKTPKQLNRQ